MAEPALQLSGAKAEAEGLDDPKVKVDGNKIDITAQLDLEDILSESDQQKIAQAFRNRDKSAIPVQRREQSGSSVDGIGVVPFPSQNTEQESSVPANQGSAGKEQPAFAPENQNSAQNNQNAQNSSWPARNSEQEGAEGNPENRVSQNKPSEQGGPQQEETEPEYKDNQKNADQVPDNQDKEQDKDTGENTEDQEKAGVDDEEKSQPEEGKQPDKKDDKESPGEEGKDGEGKKSPEDASGDEQTDSDEAKNPDKDNKDAEPGSEKEGEADDVEGKEKQDRVAERLEMLRKRKQELYKKAGVEAASGKIGVKQYKQIKNVLRIIKTVSALGSSLGDVFVSAGTFIISAHAEWWYSSRHPEYKFEPWEKLATVVIDFMIFLIVFMYIIVIAVIAQFISDPTGVGLQLIL